MGSRASSRPGTWPGNFRSLPKSFRADVGGPVILGIGLLLDWGQSAAELHRVDIPEPGLRIVCARVPAARAESRGADQRRLADRRINAADQLAGLRVYALSKVEAVAQPPDVLHISGVLIEDEDEPAFV